MFMLSSLIGWTQSISITQIRKAPASNMFLLSGTNRSFEYKNLYDFTGRVDSIYFADDSLRYVLMDSTTYALPLSFSLNGAWLLDGNTIADTNFIGTINNKDLVFKTNNIESVLFKPSYRYEFGQNIDAFSPYTFGVGINSNLIGEYGAAFGKDISLSGDYNFAFGEDISLADSYSFSAGLNNLGTGYMNYIFGRDNISSDEYNFIFGEGNYVDMFNNVIFGQSNNAESSYYGFISGRGNTIDNYGSVVFGDNNNTSNPKAYLFGSNLENISYGEFIVGQWPLYYSPVAGQDTWRGEDNLFVIANGTDTNTRSNAMTILKNGYVGINTVAIDTTFCVDGAVKFTGSGTPGLGKLWTSDANGIGSWQDAPGAGGPETDPVWNIEKTGYQENSDTTTFDATRYWVESQGYLTTYNETDPVWTSEKGDYVQYSDSTLLFPTKWWVQDQGYLTAYNETDPVFVGHTAYNIGTGTGFLRNNGAGIWSYNNSVITGTGATSRIPYYDGTNSISSTAQLTYSGNALNIGSSTDLKSNRYVFFPNIPTTLTLAEGLVWDAVAGEVKRRTFNITGWDNAADDRVVSTGFNTGDGVLTLTQNDSGTLTVDLDGRYLQTEVDGSTTNEIQTIDTFGIYDTNKIRISLSGDGQLYKTLTLPSETDPEFVDWNYEFDSLKNVPDFLVSNVTIGKDTLGVNQYNSIIIVDSSQDLTLPENPDVGTFFTFMIYNNTTLKIIPYLRGGTQTIRVPENCTNDATNSAIAVTTGTGIGADADGASLKLIYIDSNVWMSEFSSGTWSKVTP